jgi:hypothetical protein
VYEIKPYGSFQAGAAKLTFYLLLLNLFDPLRRLWIPGTAINYTPPTYIPLAPLTFAIVSPPAGGVIIYQVVDVRLEIAVLLALVAAYGLARLVMSLPALAFPRAGAFAFA